MSAARRLLTVALLAVASLLPSTAAAPPAAAAPESSPGPSMLSVSFQQGSEPDQQSFARPHDFLLVVTDSSGVVQVTAGRGNDSYRNDAEVYLRAPGGGEFAVGEYENAGARGHEDDARATLEVSGNGTGAGCKRGGRITVHDVAYVDRKVSRLWATFVQDCDDIYGWPGRFGEVRFDVSGSALSSPVQPGRVSWPDSYPGLDAKPVVLQPRPNGRLVQATVSGPDASSFRIPEGQCPTEAGGCTVTFRPSSAGPKTAVVTLTDEQGAQHQVPVTGRGLPGTTSWQHTSDPDDTIGDGTTRHWTPTEALFAARWDIGRFNGNVHMAVRTRSGDEYLVADFAAPEGEHLVAGRTYTGARGYPVQGEPQLHVSGNGSSCNDAEGMFTLHELVRGQRSQEILAFRASFAQRCSAASGWIRGELAWRASDVAASPPATNPTTPTPTTPPPSPSPSPSALSAAATTKPVLFGQRTAVRTRLTDASSGRGLAAKPVAVHARPYGASAWALVGRATTDGEGRAAVAVRPTRHTRYRVTYAGDAQQQPAASAVITVRSRPVASATASRTTVAAGSRTTVRGVVRPGHSGRTVVLQRWTGTRWVGVRKATLDRYSRYAVRYGTSRRGSVRLRVVLGAHVDHAAAVSRTITVRFT